MRTGSMRVAEISLPENASTLVLVKASGAQGVPAVYVQPLPAESPVEALGGPAAAPDDAADDAAPAPKET